MTDDFAAQLVLGHLGRGKDAAKRKAAVADELGWTERAVKRAVRDLRLDGWLISSGNAGYWIADESEVEEWIKRQNAQITAMRKTLEAVEATRARMAAHQIALPWAA